MTPDQVPAIYVERVAQVESGGNDLAKARTSSALGRFQFITGTWEGLRRQYPELGLTPNGRTDRVQAERAFRQFTADNAADFRRVMRRNPSLGELYLAHFSGSGGAVAVCSADPERLVSDVLGEGVVRANAFLRGKTCGQMIEWAERKMAARPAPAPLAPRRPPQRDANALNEAELQRIRREARQPT